jgi:ABC-2 type transport system permease protein
VAAALRSQNLAMIIALIRRAGNELVRVPGAAIPGVMAPAIFFIGFSSIFGHLTLLPGFTTSSYQSFLIPVSMLQGAGFTGAATGVNLARDIEQGWFDRLLASPAPRWVLLSGLVVSASVRALIPATFLLIIGLMLGVSWPGIGGLLLVYVLVMGMGAVAALWGTALALRFRSQSAAPLMQTGMFVAVFMTTAYAPAELLQGWLQTVSRINPVTHVIEAARQPFTSSITFAGTWPAFAAIAGLIAIFGAWALRGMYRITED